MIRPLALLLVAGLALGADGADAFAATPLRWPAGRTTLAEAVARLAAGGNRVLLATGPDDRAVADLPAVDGPWWQGAMAVCRAWSLRFDEGDPGMDHLDRPGQPVPIGQGALVLAPAPGWSPGFSIAGSLVAVVEAPRPGGPLRLWLRAEPRLARGLLPWGRCGEARLGDQVLQQAAQDEDGMRAPAACWRAAEPAPGAELRTEVARAATWRSRGRARLPADGTSLRLDLEGRAVQAALILDPAVRTWEGAALPERRPLLAVALPAESSGTPLIRLLNGENEFASRAGGRRDLADGRQLHLRFPRGTPDAPLELLVELRTADEPPPLVLAIAVPPPAPGPSGDRHLPAPLLWSAGRAPLAQWLERLGGTGNPTLAGIGIDQEGELAVAEVRGVFWDGVLAVARAAALAPAAAPDVRGGPVRLVRDAGIHGAAACGPFLVAALAPVATDDGVRIPLACAVEPRFDPDDFGPPTWVWADWAMDDRGRAHPLASRRSGPAAGLPPGVPDSDDGDGGWPMVRLLHRGARSLDLGGLLVVPRHRILRTTIDLPPSGSAEALLGMRAVELGVITPERPAFGLASGLILRGALGVSALDVAVALADGTPLPDVGQATRHSGGNRGSPWVVPARIPADAALTVTLRAQSGEAPLVLPLRLTVSLPEGL